MPEIVFVSREVHPITRGGIGTHIHAVAAALADVADVTVITHTLNEPRYRELASTNDASLPPGVRFEFVPDPLPEERGSFYSLMHAYSARVYEKLRELYPNQGPDVIEFPDYLGEGLVTIQARQTLDPALRNTRVCVRLHTSIEMLRVLNGHVADDVETQALFEAERYALAGADRLIWPGGDVLDTYRRFYGAEALAEAVNIRNARAPIAKRVTATTPPVDGPLRFLYMNRLERRKGVVNLVQAATSLRRDDWTLTLVGADSDTAPLGGSMREHLELVAAGDPRIEFQPARPREELADVYAGHHVLLCPSLWECWPYVVLEALEAGRPVVGTATGGLVEMLADADAGWLVDGRDPTGLAEALEERLDERERIDELIRSGAPTRVYRSLTDEEPLRRSYLQLAAAPLTDRPVRTDSRPPLVSVVIPYFRLHEFVEETVASVYAQDYPRLEVVLVNDGSFCPEDAILGELAERYPARVLTTVNSGLGAARNAGIRQSRGRYVFPLDADDLAGPDFVSRCVEILESAPDVAYVTSWSKYVDERGEPYLGSDDGYRPIGNSPELTLRVNVAGSAAAVIRKRIFELGHWYRTDLTSYEDWQLYRELHAAGMYGRVIPEPLLTYRIRTGSMLREGGMPHHERLLAEMNAHVTESRMEWVCRTA